MAPKKGAKEVAPAKAAKAAKAAAPAGAKKGSPTPPRFKEGEAPPLPTWGITWTTVGVRIETLLPNLDSGNLVDMVNSIGRPSMSIAIVDAETMAAEEMEVDPLTGLGNKLKEARASGIPNWLSPQLLSEVFAVRSDLDRDDEHRREAERRVIAAETCKKNIEEAVKLETEARQKFEAALWALKEFEDQLRAETANEQRASVIAAKAKEDATVAAAPITKVARYWQIKGDTMKEDPFTTTRIYWCLGFGDTAEALANHASVKNIFRAVFNLAKKPPLPPPPPSLVSSSSQLLPQPGHDDKASPAAPPPVQPTPPQEVPPPEPIPVPPFIEKLKALAKSAALDHPCRKIPIMDVLYEEAVIPDTEVAAAAAAAVPPPPQSSTPAKGGKAPAAAPKKAEPKSKAETSLPYDQIAKAVISASQCLVLQMKAFDAFEENITETCVIPAAVPFEDVSMKYYTALLDEVPPELVSVSVILHCLVEQVAVYNCPIEDLEALEVAKANKQLAKDLENSFHKLGHGLSCMRQPSTFLKDLLAKIQAEFDQEEENAKKMAKDQAAQDAAISAPAVVGGGGEEKTIAQKRASIAITSGTSKDKTAVTAVDHGVEPKSRGSKTGSALIHGARLPSIAMDIDDSLTSSETTTPISSQGSSTRTQEDEEHLLVVQEFSRAQRAATQFVMADLPLSFLDSVDVSRVEKHMLSLLSYPGKKRGFLPKTPFLSEEKRGACLTALQLFANGGPKFPAGPTTRVLDDIYGPPVVMEIPEDPRAAKFPLIPVNLAAVQRYRKLKMFLEMLREDRKMAFKIEDPSESFHPKSSIEGSGISAQEMGEEIDEVQVTEEEAEEQRRKEKEKYLIDCGCPGVKIYRQPTPPPEPDPPTISLEDRLFFYPFTTILDRRYLEAFADGLLGEIYGQTKCLLPYETFKYDRDEDCLLIALFADDRDHEWEGTIAFQVGFASFVAKMNSPSPAMTMTSKHAVYEMEENYATIVERFRCHLTEEQGLVWCGLPSMSPIQWEPSTTVIKDGNMIMMRGVMNNNHDNKPNVGDMEKSIVASLRDGVVVCFFLAKDGSMSVQVTTVASQTFELTSTGAVLMFPSKIHAKQKQSNSTSKGKEAPPKGKEPSKKDSSQQQQQQQQPVAAAAAATATKEEEEAKELPISNTQTIRDILLKEKGDVELWRSVLPSGTVIRYKENGGAQILCRQGNVSEYRKDFQGGGACWVTANNQGFLVVQKKKKEGAPASPDEGEEEEGGEGEGEGEEAQAKAEQEQEQVVNPKLVQLPNLKVAHFYDPDSGNEIMTREDLVVVITSTEHRTCLVQHADGTYIHSETKEIYHAQDVVTSGKLMMEQITEAFPTKQHPLIGDKIANIPPDRPGLQVSTFASPQTKHSATWPPLGYGEAPQDLPEHVWPPREQTSPKQRYTTPPDLPPELPQRDPLIEVSTTWHVRKDGQPKVHGKVGRGLQIGCGVAVEFATTNGHYCVTWAKENKQLSVAMPGGSMMYAVGNTVTFDPTDGSKKYDPLQSEDNERKHGPFTNTNGLYIFDVVEGSLLFTNNAGEGFKVFGQGTKFEGILGGKYESQIAKEAEDYEAALLAWASTTPDGLLDELDARAAAKNPDVEDPTPPSTAPPEFPATGKASQTAKEQPKPSGKPAPPAPTSKAAPTGKDAKAVKEQSKAGGKLQLPLQPEGPQKGSRKGSKASISDDLLQPPGEWKPPVPGSRPTTPTPPPSESPEPVMLGPYPRLFVIHDGGHGYEILPEEIYQLYTIAKSHDRECTKVDELFVKLEENVVFHTFVTVERNGNLPPLTFLKEEEKTETSFPVSPALLTRRVSQFARCFQAKQRNSKLQTRTKCDWLQLDFMLPNLPRIINPVLPKLEAVVNESSFVYRQVCEHPFINEETNGHIDKILEAYAEWQLENLQLQRIEKIVDNRDDDMIAMEKEIACRIRENKKFKERESVRT
ncbi:hypothetical protein BDL97_13G088400 [Sphagnum fallax]|nr:hypothetical protein BDL97_13G088400 [Sphagnum fallax]